MIEDLSKKVKISNCKNGKIFSFGVCSLDPVSINESKDNTNKSYDRIAVYFNNLKSSKSTKPIFISFFGLYDGYGGHICSNYMKDNLHKAIFKSKYFPKNLSMAINDAVKFTLKSYWVYKSSVLQSVARLQNQSKEEIDFGVCGVQAFFTVGDTGILFSLGKGSNFLISQARSVITKNIQTFTRTNINIGYNLENGINSLGGNYKYAANNM